MADGELKLIASMDTKQYEAGEKRVEKANQEVVNSTKKAKQDVDKSTDAMGDGFDNIGPKAAGGAKETEAPFKKMPSIFGSIGDMLPDKLLPAAAFGAAAAAVGAVVKDSVENAVQQINVQARLEAAFGDTSMAKKAGEIAGEVYADGWGDSLQDVADTTRQTMQICGDVSEEEAAKIVKSAYAIEDVFSGDVNESIRGVNAIMKAFGKTGDEAADLLVKGFQRGLDYSGEFADNLSEYAGRWGDAGVSAEEYFSLLEAGSKNGAYQLDKVGDFLNEFLTSLTDGRMEAGIQSMSDGTQAVFKSYQEGGATAQDVLNAVVGEMNGMTDETKRAALASELWGSLGEDNAWTMIGALGDVENSFGDVSGAADDFTEKSKTIEQRWESVQRRFSQGLGEAFLPAIESAVGFFDENMDQINQTVQATSDFIGDVFTGIGDTLMAFFQPIIDIASGPVSDLSADLLELGETVMPIFQAAWEAVAPILSEVGETIGEIVAVISETLGPIIEGITAWIQDNLPEIVATIQEYGEIITNTVSTICDTISGVVSGVMSIISGVINVVMGIITGDWDRAWNGVEQITGGWGEATESIIDGTSKNSQNIMDLLGLNAKTIFRGAWDAVKNITKNAWDGIKGAIKSGIDGAIDNVRQLPSRAQNALGNIGGTLYGAGVDLIRGFSRGIEAAIGSVVSAVRNGVSRVVSAAKGLLGIASPSKVFRDEVGRWVPEGMAVGIEKWTPDAVEASVDMADAAVKSVMGLPDLAVGQIAPHPTATVVKTAVTNVESDTDVEVLKTAFRAVLSEVPRVRVMDNPRDAAVWVAREIDEELETINRRRSVTL